MNSTAMLRIMLLAAVATAAHGANVNNIPRLEDNITPRQAQQQCDPQTEQQCTRCSYGKDGAPIPEYYCAPSDTIAGGNDGSGGCPEAVCCNVRTEETCYDETTEVATSCARYDEGGCPCPEGQVRCGVSQFSSGYCTSLCCDWTIEETCYDGNMEPAYCKRYDDGTCPNPSLNTQGVRINRSDGDDEKWNGLFQ